MESPRECGIDSLDSLGHGVSIIYLGTVVMLFKT